MTKLLNKKYLSVFILLIISLLISWKFYFQEYSQQDIINIHDFPKEIKGWLSEEITITEDEYAILETRNAFARQYTSSAGQKVILYIVYSEGNRKVSHPPEICYTGGGNVLVNKKRDTVHIPGLSLPIAVNKLYLEQGELNQIAYYWFKVGKTFTPSYWKQQGLVALNNFKNKKTSSAMIRVSAVEENGRTEKAEEDIRQFIHVLYPNIIALN